jgi:serine/threonine protein kinase
MDERIGQQFGNYRLGDLLGEGAFAKVYLGEHIHLGSHVAIKILDTKLISHNQDAFLREARTIAGLEHASIIQVLDCGIQNGIPFLIMSYAPHGTLRQRHPSGSILPIEAVIVYVQQISSALQYAHDRKLIHRDVKPENMLLGRNNEVLLSDFGIALISSSTSSQSTKGAAGTASYMAPEQIMGKPCAASDQYALGVVIYEWLCGERPFRGSLTEVCAQHLYAPLPPFSQYPNISVPPEVEAVVMKALSKEASQRFAHIQDFAAALEEGYQYAKTGPLRERPQALSEKTTFRNNSLAGDDGYAPTEISEANKPTALKLNSSPTSSPVHSNNDPTALKLNSDPTSRSVYQDNDPTALKIQSGTINSNRREELAALRTRMSSQTHINQPPAYIPATVAAPMYPATPALPLTGCVPRRSSGKTSIVMIACLIVLLLLVASPFAYNFLLSSWQAAQANSPSSRATSHTPQYQSTATSGHMGTSTSTQVTSTPTQPAQTAQRQLTATQTQSQTVPTTGTKQQPAVKASGTLVVTCRAADAPLTIPAGTVFTGNDGVQVTTALVTANCNIALSTTVSAHASQPGAGGNIAANDMNQPYSGYSINNPAAFAGGQDAATSPVVKQSDIDGAASPLKTSTQQKASTDLKNQLYANEHLVGTPQCTSNVSSNHNAGDVAANVTVTVETTCTGTAST